MTLDDLKNIDINNIPGWPLPVKIGGIVLICVVLLFGGYWFLVADELAQYEQEQTKETGLKETYLNKKGLAINLPAYKLQMDEMHQAFGTLLRQLPNKTEVPNLLVDITQAGLGRGLNFVLFKPEKEKPQEFYDDIKQKFAEARDTRVLIASSNDYCAVYNNGDDANGAPIPLRSDLARLLPLGKQRHEFSKLSRARLSR